MARELVLRQVDAPAARVLADVADDVGELEGDAEVARVASGSPDSRSRRSPPTSARPHPRRSGNSARARRSRDSGCARGPSPCRRSRSGNAPAAGRYVATTGCRARATGCCGVPVNAAAISLRHQASFVRASCRIRNLVDDIVDLAAERVERRDRAAPLGRQEQEAVVEARAAAGRLLLAVLVRRHAARSGFPETVAARRKQRVAGDSRPVRPQTVWGAGGRRRRRWHRCRRGSGGRQPARPESSSTSRQGSARTSGRPDSSSSLARADSNAMSARHASSQRASATWASVTPKRCRSSAGRYSRPRRQSSAMSCQKLISCSAVQIASLAR